MACDCNVCVYLLRSWWYYVLIDVIIFSESKGDSGDSPRVLWLDEPTIRLSRSLEAATTSSQHYLEVALVADRTMADYHSIEELEAYLFTLMNMVSAKR